MMVLVGVMGQIEAGHINTGSDEPVEFTLAIRSGAEGGDDLSASGWHEATT